MCRVRCRRCRAIPYRGVLDGRPGGARLGAAKTAAHGGRGRLGSRFVEPWSDEVRDVEDGKRWGSTDSSREELTLVADCRCRQLLCACAGEKGIL